MKTNADVVMKPSTEGGRSMMHENGAHAVTEDDVYMEDMIICAVLGINEIPEGYHVKHRNGNTLDNCRNNLELVND